MSYETGSHGRIFNRYPRKDGLWKPFFLGMKGPVSGKMGAPGFFRGNHTKTRMTA